MPTGSETMALPSSEPSQPGETRFLIPNLGWSGYETILGLLRERPSPRLAFLKGDLELMSPGYRHETIGERLGHIVSIITEELDIPCQPAAHTTFRRRDLERGIEADKSFYIANEARVRELDEIDLNIHPPPDLAIEVEITHAMTDLLAIYAGLGVPELWRCDGRTLRFLHLQGDGSYGEAPTSRAFPFLRSDEVLSWVNRPKTVPESRWLREVRTWARETLGPRFRREGGR